MRSPTSIGRFGNRPYNLRRPAARSAHGFDKPQLEQIDKNFALGRYIQLGALDWRVKVIGERLSC